MAEDRRTVLVTGSTDGVGRAVAARLGTEGVHVLVHGRDTSRGEAVVAGIRDRGGRATFYPADLAALDAVRGLSDMIRRDHAHLDLLVNNAGIGVGRGGRELSPDGHELRFAVNYLSGFLLTRLLLPCLGRIRGSRIVNVSSAGQQAIDFDDVMLTRGYDGRRAYCQSKLAQIMFTIDLAQELADRGVSANAIHPATYMDTAMVRRDGITPTSTVAEGADAILRLATSREHASTSGRYFAGTREARPDPQAADADARRRLRNLSLDLTGLSAG